MSSHMRSRSTNRCILSADYMPGTELSSKLKVKLSSKLSLTLSKCSVNVTYLYLWRVSGLPGRRGAENSGAVIRVKVPVSVVC